MKTKKAEKQKLIKEADRLWSLVIRQKYNNICCKCGNRGTSAHHIVSRTHKNTRWDIENGLCLGFPCHIHFMHGKPVESTKWLRQRMGDQFIDNLLKKSQIIFKPTVENMRRIVEELENKLKELEN